MPPLSTHPLSLERLRALARYAAGAASVGLVAFHGWLFAAQAVDGRFDDPWLMLRWVVALGLVAGLAAIRHAGGSVWNRQGLAVWVVAALLHGPAMTTDFAESISLAPPQTAAASILQSLMAVSALAATLWMVAGLLKLRDRYVRLHLTNVAAHAQPSLFSDGFSPQYFSRPPPQSH